MMDQSCFDRVYKSNSSSPEILFIVGCLSDMVAVPGFEDQYIHKETVGIIIVVCDICSFLLMYLVFVRLQAINDEYITILDNNIILCSSFTI